MNDEALSPSPAGRGARGEGHYQKLPLPPDLLAFTKKLRSEQTDPENLLWRILRGRRFLGLKFRRQYPMPPYILDFYCVDLGIGVELDGGQHNDVKTEARDVRRSEYLNERGIEVIRYWNHDVMLRTEMVLEDLIGRLAVKVRPSPDATASTSPGGRGNRGALREQGS